MSTVALAFSIPVIFASWDESDSNVSRDRSIHATWWRKRSCREYKILSIGRKSSRPAMLPWKFVHTTMPKIYILQSECSILDIRNRRMAPVQLCNKANLVWSGVGPKAILSKHNLWMIDGWSYFTMNLVSASNFFCRNWRFGHVVIKVKVVSRKYFSSNFDNFYNKPREHISIFIGEKSRNLRRQLSS